MKKFFTGILLMAAVLPMCALAGNSDLTGNWKEVRRMDPAGKVLDYTDTFRVEFKIGNEYLWMRPNTFQYRGTYTKNAQTLDLGIRTFTIITDTRQKLVLKDDAGTYELARYTPEAIAENNAAAGNGNRAKADEMQAEGVKDMAQLKGKWDVYKRTNGGEKTAIDYTRILKTITVSSDARSGQVYSAEDMPGKPSWTVDRLADNILYCKGRDARELKVLKCSATELIVQEGTVTYFFKQFKG